MSNEHKQKILKYVYEYLKPDGAKHTSITQAGAVSFKGSSVASVPSSFSTVHNGRAHIVHHYERWRAHAYYEYTLCKRIG